MKNEDLHAQLPDVTERPEDEQPQSPLTTMPVKWLTNAFILADKDYIASRIIESVESGESDPLKILAGLKAMENLVISLTDKNPKTNRNADKAKFLNDCIMSASDYQGGKKFSLYGATFTKTEVGTKYDYSLCNDSKLADLESAAKEASEALKKRQDFLKMVDPKGLDILDAETGETYTVYPPSKSSTSTVSVSFK